MVQLQVLYLCFLLEGVQSWDLVVNAALHLCRQAHGLVAQQPQWMPLELSLS